MERSEDSPLDRRNFLKMAGAAAGAAGLQGAYSRNSERTQVAMTAERAGEEIIANLGAYISGRAMAVLPETVVETAKHHILDTLAAVVSGSTLTPGRLALEYVQRLGGEEEAQVAASRILTSAVNAAFANGMMAHADETDDSHTKTLVHPGSAVVPAALAMSERWKADGRRFLRSVVVGYDVGCRMILALDPDYLLQGSGATPGIGGCFGAAAASAAVAGIDEDLIPQVLSYAAQLASGINFWMRDLEHVQKAFVFGGMPAKNGVTAARMVQAGFTGVPDFLTGEHNFFRAFSTKPDPRRLTAGLNHEYEIMFTDMKKYPVGFPIQAPLEALLTLMKQHGLGPDNIKSIVARLPSPGVRTVNDRGMPDINLQYILAAAVIDGTLSFGTAHSSERMRDPAVLEIKKRVVLTEEPDLTAAGRTREAIVEVTTNDGRKFVEHGFSKGTTQHPMTREEVDKKSRELMSPVLGEDRTENLIRMIRNLEEVKDMSELRPSLSLR